MGLSAVPCDRRTPHEAGGLRVVETPGLGPLDHRHVSLSLVLQLRFQLALSLVHPAEPSERST
jgi:hypothetical protein